MNLNVRIRRDSDLPEYTHKFHLWGRCRRGGPDPNRLKVWYFNLEDPLEEIDRRVAAPKLHYKIAIEGRLFKNGGRDTPLVIGEK
jgi:hypothetical protein